LAAVLALLIGPPASGPFDAPAAAIIGASTSPDVVWAAALPPPEPTLAASWQRVDCDDTPDSLVPAVAMVGWFEQIAHAVAAIPMDPACPSAVRAAFARGPPAV
jgi:hypothetical protein